MLKKFKSVYNPLVSLIKSYQLISRKMYCTSSNNESTQDNTRDLSNNKRKFEEDSDEQSDSNTKRQKIEQDSKDPVDESNSNKVLELINDLEQKKRDNVDPSELQSIRSEIKKGRNNCVENLSNAEDKDDIASEEIFRRQLIAIDTLLDVNNEFDLVNQDSSSDEEEEQSSDSQSLPELGHSGPSTPSDNSLTEGEATQDSI